MFRANSDDPHTLVDVEYVNLAVGDLWRRKMRSPEP